MHKTPKFPGSTIRRTWRMNPVTRVHDNDPGKNKKAQRRAVKKRLAEELRNEPPAFCVV